jgi:ribonuclease III
MSRVKSAKNRVLYFFSGDKQFYQSLKNMLGFRPANVLLYQQAFRHSSAAKELKSGVKNSNERLEFLGDAIIGTIVAEYLFCLFPYEDEGFLTKMRSKIVSRESLSQLSKKIGVDLFIESDLDRKTASNAVKGNAFEALVGAIYLDKGYNQAKQFLLKRVIKPHIDLEAVKNQEDYKSKLIEWAQKEKKELRFNMLEDAKGNNDKLYSIEIIINNEPKGRGKDYSKRKAEQLAAQQACENMSI